MGHPGTQLHLNEILSWGSSGTTGTSSPAGRGDESQLRSDNVCPGYRTLRSKEVQDLALKINKTTKYKSNNMRLFRKNKISKIWSRWISPTGKQRVVFLGHQGCVGQLEGHRGVGPNPGGHGDTGTIRHLNRDAAAHNCHTNKNINYLVAYNSY